MLSDYLIILGLLFPCLIIWAGSAYYLFIVYIAGSQKLQRRIPFLLMLAIGPHLIHQAAALIMYKGTCTWKTPYPCSYGEYLIDFMGGVGLRTGATLLWFGVFTVLWAACTWISRILFRRQKDYHPAGYFKFY